MLRPVRRPLLRAAIVRQVPLVASLVAGLALATLAPASAQLVPEQNGIDAGALLAPHGYSEVEIVRRRIDRIEAEACRGGDRWRVTLLLLSNRARAWDRLGPCRPPAPGVASQGDGGTGGPDPAGAGVAAAPILPPWSEEDAAMRALERVGYTGVRLRKWGREGWRGTACRDGSIREVRVSVDLRPATPLRAMRACPEARTVPRDLTKGPPDPSTGPIRSVRDVKGRLIAAGYEGVGRIEIRDGAYHAEGCEGGWRFRVTMRPDGAVAGRRNLGACAAQRASATLPAGAPEVVQDIAR